MGEARAAARLTPSPSKDVKGDAWVGLLAAGFGPIRKIFRAERPEGEARKLFLSWPH